MTNLLDQQFVAHLFTPAAGLNAPAAWQAIGEIWRGCEVLFGLSAPIAETGLPSDLPDPAALATAVGVGGEVALAARGRPGATGQALLRLQHDVLVLSVGLTEDAAPPPSQGAAPRWWRNTDFQWSLLADRHAAACLGEARLFLTRADADAQVRTADQSLYAELAALLPVAPGAASAGVAFPGGFTLWEVGRWPDDRASRRLLVAIAPDADPAASNWAWSPNRTPAIPPLARYLLHAAKLRYEARVVARDSQARLLAESLNALSADVRRSRDPGALALLRRRQMDAVMLRADLLAVHRTVEIAAENLRRAFGLFGPGEPEAIPGSPFADDAGVAQSIAERVDDELGYLAIASERAAGVESRFPAGTAQPASQPESAVGTSPAGEPAAAPGPAATAGPDIERRNVFVVYGRDEEARSAVFTFLRALGLNPLEWEELVQATGKMGPFLSETVRIGLDRATAVVVLLTPDDVVHLHPDLHDATDGIAETGDSLQARPNVLLELGMAMAAKPDQTLILIAGQLRAVTDLGGMSYVTLSGDPACRNRIADRLRGAGCAVKPRGTDWLTAGNFDGLAARYRKAAGP